MMQSDYHVHYRRLFSDRVVPLSTRRGWMFPSTRCPLNRRQADFSKSRILGVGPSFRRIALKAIAGHRCI